MAIRTSISALQARLESAFVDFGEQANEAEIDEILRQLTGHLTHANGRSFYDHLKGTREILAAWKQPLWIQLGGLFHSIYSTEAYPNQVLPLEKRTQLRRIIGKKAERLSYLFASCSRKELIHTVAIKDACEHRMPLTDRFTGAENLVDRKEVFALLVIIMANQAEQSCAPDGGPGRWVAQLSRIALQLRKAEGQKPLILESCSTELPDTAEQRLVERYRAALHALCTNQQEAAAAFKECGRLCPWLAEPLIWRAYIAMCRNERESAALLADSALKKLDVLGTGWDKRLSLAEWKEIGAALLDGRNIAHLRSDLVSSPTTLAQSLGIRISRCPTPVANGPCKSLAPTLTNSETERLETYLGRLAVPSAGRLLHTYPLEQGPPWYESGEFPIAQALENSFEAIRAEIAAFEEQRFHAEGEKIHRTGAWDVIMLYERGRKNTGNCLKCPTVTHIVENYDTVRTLAGLIYISRLGPGTHVAAHCGPTNIRVRCHLGIKIPAGDCALRVGNEIRRWNEGKCIVFDDFYEHEVWNNTREARVVLIIDLWHPQLSARERRLLAGLHAYGAAQAEALQRYWSVNDKLRAEKRLGYD